MDLCRTGNIKVRGLRLAWAGGALGKSGILVETQRTGRSWLSKEARRERRDLECSRGRAKARGLPPVSEGCRAEMHLEGWGATSTAAALRKPPSVGSYTTQKNHRRLLLQKPGSICFLTWGKDSPPVPTVISQTNGELFVIWRERQLFRSSEMGDS